MRLLYRGVFPATLVVLSLVLPGCGYLIDKDNIKVAKIGNDYITRGDLDRVIRDMPDDQRPIIQNKGDLQRVLRNYIEGEVKRSLAEDMVSKKLVNIPREVAEQQFDAQHPEYKRVATMERPEDFDLTKYDVEVMKDEREIGIDKLHEQMLEEAAIGYRIQQGLQNNTLNVTPQELKDEYEMRTDEMHSLEKAEFIGIRFFGTESEARAQAAQVIKRVEAGEDFEAIATQYKQSNPDSLMVATIENNPELAQFRGVWEQLHGAEVGQVIGPVYLPPSGTVSEQSGRSQVVPGSILVLKVLSHAPEQLLTVEEAAPQLAQPILYAKMIKKLHEEYGVEIYDENLPDPSAMGGSDEYSM